jgi:uncharacterized RDD family membrane protein YckC
MINQLFPSVGTRLKASVIDGILVISFIAVLGSVYSMARYESPLISLIIFTILFGYEPIMVWKRGMTVGHQIMGIRVIDTHNKTNITLKKAMLRFIVKSLLGSFSFVWALFSDSQKTLHDLITKSQVIYKSVSLDKLKEIDFSKTNDSSFSPQYIQQSKIKRFAITFLWELIAFIFVCIMFAFFYPKECLESNNRIADLNCQTYDMILSIVWGSITIIVLIFGSSGRLPGAKRIRKANND